MRRVPLGGVSPQVRSSLGGSCDVLNFYCTSYNSSYGSSQFIPGGASHPGLLVPRSTGYQSNMRPAVYYSPNLDRKDNPSLGLILRNNYTSITNRDYGPYEPPTGSEALPHALHPPKSGYVRSSVATCPKSRSVKSVHFDTRDHGTAVIPGLLPRHQPLLHEHQGKASPEYENLRHGPSFMSTEYKTRYTTRQPHQTGRQDVVSKITENTGYTEESNMEPITFDPHTQYRAPRGFHRWMGHSITKTDFLPTTTLQGREPLPALAKNSDRSSGFSRETDKALNIPASFDDSLPFDSGKQKQDLLGRVSFGTKELSGFSLNNKVHVNPGIQSPEQYLTNYNHRFCDPTSIGKDREGWTRGGIQGQSHSGFSVNNEGHIPGL